MKKVLLFAAVSMVALAMSACSDNVNYDPGRGTASRPDVSYTDYSGPEQEQGGQLDFGENVLSLPGEWHIVSTNP